MGESGSGSISELSSESESPMVPFPQVLPQQHRMNSKGYIRLYGYAPPELCDALLAAARDQQPTAWRKLFGSGGMDSKRQIAKAPDDMTAALSNKIEDGCRTFFPKSEPRDWMFIKSMPFGNDQPAHRDFLPISSDQDLYDYCILPASVLVGLEDSSYIYGYGWNRQVAMEEDKEKITFDKGDVLMFRGDYIHQGGGYVTENTRLHFFLDPTKRDHKVRNKDTVDFVHVIPKKLPTAEKAERTCSIFGCSQAFLSAALCRSHIRKQHNIYFNRYPSIISQPPKKAKSQRGVCDSSDTKKTGPADDRQKKRKRSM